MTCFKYLIAAIAMVTVLTCATFLYVHRGSGAESPCLSDSHHVASGHGPYAEVVETSCDAFGGSNTVEVFLVDDDSGKSQRTLVFKYNPSSFSGPLSVMWSGGSDLYIRIERVDFIATRLSSTGRYSIRYAIGAIGPARLQH